LASSRRCRFQGNGKSWKGKKGMSLQDLFGDFPLPLRAVFGLFGEVERYGPPDGLVPLRKL